MTKKYSVTSLNNKGGNNRLYLNNGEIIIDVPHKTNISENSKLEILFYEEETSIPKGTPLLQLNGIIFRSFVNKSLFSAGGLLAQLPQKYKMGQELYIVIK